MIGTMNVRISLVFLALGTLAALGATEKKAVMQTARTVLFPDGTKTEATIDLAIREQTEITYNAQGVKTARKVYLLNEQGQPVQGNVYDGKDQLKARAQFFFDEFGRLSEQRMLNLQGEIFQRIVFSYDKNGNPLPPKSFNYGVKSPSMQAAPIDFTKPQADRPRLDRSQGDPVSPAPQGNVPYLPGTAQEGSGGLAPLTLGAGDQSGSKAEPEKKRGILSRIFGGKKKDEKK